MFDSNSDFVVYYVCDLLACSPELNLEELFVFVFVFRLESEFVKSIL